MASFVSTGSPRSSRKSTPIVNVLDQGDTDDRTQTSELSVPKLLHSSKSSPTPLKSTKLSNLQQTRHQEKKTTGNQKDTKTGDLSGMEDILARLRINDSRKTSNSQAQALSRLTAEPSALDKLLTDLNGKNKALKKQEMDLKDESESDNHKDEDRSSGSSLFTPATDSFDVISEEDTQDEKTIRLDHAEILRVKKELAAAKSLISRQEQELAESRTLKHTMDQALGPPSEVDFGHHDVSEQTIDHLQSAFNASAPSFTMDSQVASWQRPDIVRPEAANIPSSGRGRGIWTDQIQTPYANGVAAAAGSVPIYANTRDAQLGPPAYSVPYGSPISPIEASFPSNQRTFSGSGSSAASYGFDNRYGPDLLRQPPGVMRRNMNRITSSSGFSDPSSLYGSFPTSSTMSPAMTPVSPIGPPQSFGYQPRQLGPPLSPSGSDFATPSIPGINAPWSTLPAANGQTYVTPLEPMNYRRLLDKSVSCDWKYIVDKIVCSNDQQASIFLQQKLKVGTAEQKFEIVESIVNQAYPLMINRFGNFLVQRCFEHGTPEQVVAIANAIHGNVLSLSMDAFGCHVIQKAFDSVPENHKADMVRELLRRIPDTVIHRYACHVWQKLFELRWSGEPPQIMLKVNEALRGMWHEVALGETGSLVVQNIFENCVEEEKRPAIEEVIASIDLIAHGQFGNWCIQHLCEHGSPSDKRRVIDHILTNSYSYSIDQFASKVVEKCLKIGGVEFLDRYLSVITNALPDRPRIPLIDIAGDQYGNYLIQWILMNTHHHQREQVAVHIRKHMVSLRGSKFGSRVAMLCCNPASVTRPGPGAIVNPFGAPGQPRGWGRFR